jgi:ribosomal protein S18 acetylase RimI-like enzyme
MRLAPLDPARLDALIALQNRLMPAHRRWNPSTARSHLLDHARAGGRNVRIAHAGNRVVGFAGWVDVGAASGEFYGAPLYVEDRPSAEALIDYLLGRARASGAAWIRVSAWPGELDKRDALAAAGFTPRLSFLTFERELDDGVAPPLPAGLSRVAPGEIDMEAFAALHNLCFRDVDNAPEITAAIAADMWSPGEMLLEACDLLVDDGGRYQAWTTVHKDGVLDAVGVSPTWQRRGLARVLVRRAMAAAYDRGLRRLRSVIADSNSASLGLHDQLGFRETDRMTTFQLDLR